MKKELIVEGRTYLEASNRTPIMVCDESGRICALETLLKEAELFDYVKPRKGIKNYYGRDYEVNKKVTKADVEGQFKKVRLTVTVEEV